MFNCVDRVESITYPIDVIVSRNKAGPFQMMKIDVQGSELFALRGAYETLRTVEVIIIELSIVQYNKGAPSYLSVLNALEELEYSMYTIGSRPRQASAFQVYGHALSLDSRPCAPRAI